MQLHVINVGTASWHLPEGVGKFTNIFDKHDAVTNLTHGDAISRSAYALQRPETYTSIATDMDGDSINTSLSPQHHSFYLYAQVPKVTEVLGFLSDRPSPVYIGKSFY